MPIRAKVQAEILFTSGYGSKAVSKVKKLNGRVRKDLILNYHFFAYFAFKKVMNSKMVGSFKKSLRKYFVSEINF